MTKSNRSVICYDPFHVVQLVTAALDKVRRQVWQDLGKLPDKDVAHKFKGHPLGVAQEPGRPHRRPGRHAAQAHTPRR
ncbi:MAG: transposase [Actinobacteria bacterium]|nr:transposase [Actinomycetota bacterium]